jgi:hypothetical protein
MSGANSKQCPTPLPVGLQTAPPQPTPTPTISTGRWSRANKQVQDGKWVPGGFEVVTSAYTAPDSPKDDKETENGPALPPTAGFHVGGGSGAGGSSSDGKNGLELSPTAGLHVGGSSSAGDDSSDGKTGLGLPSTAGLPVGGGSSTGGGSTSAEGMPTTVALAVCSIMMCCWSAGCDTEEVSWKRFEHHFRDPETNAFIMTCWRCIMKREPEVNSEMEARAFIIETSPGYKDKQNRRKDFVYATKNIQENFPRLTQKGKQTLRIFQLKDTFAPISEYMAKVAQHMVISSPSRTRRRRCRTGTTWRRATRTSG